MLFYTILLTLANVFAFVVSISTILSKFNEGGAGYIIKVVVICGAIILNTIILVTLVLFFKFHLGLVLDNQTTLETLELKRQGKNPEDEVSEYSLGKKFYM